MNKSVYRYILRFTLLIIFLGFFACYPSLKEEPRKSEQALIPVKFFYPRFSDDMDFRSLTLAIKKDFEYLARLEPGHLFQYGPHKFSSRQVRDSLELFLQLISKNPNPRELNRKIKRFFRVYRAAGRVGNRRVLFTGYFEPIFEARLQPDKRFKYPIFRKPPNLLQIDLSLFNKRFKGDTVIARIEGNRVLPYYSRRQIEVEKVLSGKNLEIAWLKDPIDVAFLHIQGSGRLRLPDGKIISVGYEASNGRSYQSIGRYMIDKELLNREEMSMQSIRNYLSRHPDMVDEVLDHNQSYVFFRPLKYGPVGNINVLLTAGRSIALSTRLFPKGSLCYIASEKPVIGRNGKIKSWTNFSRFVLNQDTGGAIQGAGRVDIFWGSDHYAELAAGHMKHEGKLYVLIKKP